MIIPRFRYSYTLADAFEAVRCLFSRQATDLPEVQALFPDARIYWVSSARQGLRFALESFGLPKGAKVGVQPYTCSSVFSAITAAGMEPVFIDINSSLTLCGTDLARKISQIDALIVTHTFGIPADISAIKEIAPHIPVIEDCAHALYSRYSQRQVGVFFDAAVFSFGNGKFPSLGGGGMLVVNNPRLDASVADKVSRLKQATFLNEFVHIFKAYFMACMHSRPVQWALHAVVSESYFDLRNQQALTYGAREGKLYRSTKWLLKKRFRKLEGQARRQRENCFYLRESGKANYTSPANPADDTNAFAFVLLEEDRDALYRYLREKNILGGKHFQHAVRWASAYGYQKGDCPTFESLAGRILTIPCYYSLNQSDLNRIAESLVEYKHIPSYENNPG